MGLAAHEAGYDVFLGNIRGVYPRKVNQKLTADKNFDYWNYAIDEVAKYDIYAFI